MVVGGPTINRWLTADHHFWHENIIRYCDRPFRHALEMNAYMEERWNAVVAPCDVVYHLGDFAFQRDDERVMRLLKRLHGTKHLFQGNHDKSRNTASWLFLGFTTVSWMGALDGFRLVHEPLYQNDISRARHRPPTFCGHIHNLWIRAGFYLNVGVDVWDFTPLAWDDAVAYFENRTPDG